MADKPEQPGKGPDRSEQSQRKMGTDRAEQSQRWGSGRSEQSRMGDDRSEESRDNAEEPRDARSSDRIEKGMFIRAPRSRVWRALTNSKEFGQWFSIRPEGEFSEGETTRANMTSPGYEHLPLEMEVEQMQPEKYFSYRWHPYAMDPMADYSNEPTTLVEFNLEEAEGGTDVTVTESGFDGLPSNRRDEAYQMNDGGWAEQLGNLARHVS